MKNMFSTLYFINIYRTLMYIRKCNMVYLMDLKKNSLPIRYSIFIYIYIYIIYDITKLLTMILHTRK